MYNASQTVELTLELFHFQTNTSLQFPANLSVICIGKPNDPKPPDIDVSGLSGSDVVSRIHAQIWINGDLAFPVDISCLQPERYSTLIR
ncbi:hypothetical protein [Nostoc sp. NMS8]|uniref:hypothetical protein n=1 Tax=Nostoc sp. NMS8 TaxID=2815392 RepID=UPI0025F2C69A|nr:hypothetical protein [Nostoc sp. NMS8]